MAVRTFVRHCWLLIRPISGPAMPFSVTCECGGSISGIRGTRHQILSCPICGQALFVLSRSPWPAPDGDQLPPPQPRWRAWRMPLIAGVATLLVVVAVFSALLPSLIRQKPEATEPRNLVAEIHGHQQLARQALAEGRYPRALAEVNAAKELSDRHPNALDHDQHFQLEQLHRQSDLLARLAKVQLAALVMDPLLAPKEEGNSLLFYSVFRTEAKGRLTVDKPELPHGEETVRLDLEDLRVLRDLLHDLPSEPPPRVLLLARLAKVTREPSGWVFRFDNGVLITDLDAARYLPVDEELRTVLERQQKWLLKNSGR